jgi:hypothetical protein
VLIVQIFIFIFGCEGLKSALRWANPCYANGSDVHYILIGDFQYDIDNAALSGQVHFATLVEYVASCAKNGEDFLLVSDEVVPVDNWIESIENARQFLPQMKVCFGRRYNAEVASRGALQNVPLGAKYKDNIPNLIRGSIIDPMPISSYHAIEVSSFPMFFNWFSGDLLEELKSALDVADDFDDLARYFELLNESGKSGFYYIPSLAVIDKELF